MRQNWNIELLVRTRTHHTRKCELPLHKPHKVSEPSYHCKQGKHKLACSKLNCPCECHKEEVYRGRVTPSR